MVSSRAGRSTEVLVRWFHGIGAIGMLSNELVSFSRHYKIISARLSVLPVLGRDAGALTVYMRSDAAGDVITARAERVLWWHRECVKRSPRLIANALVISLSAR